MQRLLVAREAASLLSISERSLWTLTNSGQIPVVRIGRSLRYRPETLLEWLEQREAVNRTDRRSD